MNSSVIPAAYCVTSSPTLGVWVPLAKMAERVRDTLAAGKSDQDSYADKETKILLHLPRFLLKTVIRLQGALDSLGLLPGKFIENDLFYASAFIANIGSLGLDAAFHHLYEYGNIPIFLVAGKIQPMASVRDNQVVVRPTMEMKITYDERIEDGFYAARALDRFRKLLENPEDLL